MDVVLTGTNTNFVLGSNTLVSFRPTNGSTVNPIVVQKTSVVSSNQLKVTITVPENLCKDTFTVSIKTDNYTIDLEKSFVVTNNNRQLTLTSSKIRLS